MATPLPTSQTDLATSLLGLAAAFAMVGILRFLALDLHPIFAAVLVMLACAAPPVLADLFYFKRYQERETGLGKRTRRVSLAALLQKCLGLYATLLSFALLYFIIPEYHNEMYAQYWSLVWLVLPFYLLATPFYLYWCMRRDGGVTDGYDEVALLVRGHIKKRDWAAIGRHTRNWLVKAFFLPLMMTYMMNATDGVIHRELDFSNFTGIYDFTYAIIMFADLLFASIGYVLTLRMLNAHIRSSDPTFRGWVVAICCYTPFWDSLLYSRYFAYQDKLYWGEWLQHFPIISAVWGTAILLLLGIYALATVCLGIRFSNLTYRGLITSGPYRFTKHPAYVTKNLSWWLVSIPFVSSGSVVDAIVSCLLLLGVNFIYYLRARTEELHLSHYPEYVEYALAMNERSIFKPLVKYLPFLEYRKPKNPPAI